jgi:heme exporter protein C
MQMKWFRWVWLAATLALLGEAFYQAMYVAPTEATMGDIQRIFYYHFASAMLTFLFFFICFAASIVFLAYRHRDPLRAMNADALALAAAEMGVVFCTAVLIQGPLWARPVWGIWWTWDARLTTTLVLWLIYVSYLLLRRFAAGPQMQTLASVLGIFGALDVPIVYMSNRWWRTQHPAPVFFGGPDSGVDPSMMPAFLWNFLGWSMWGVFLVSLRYGLERMRQARARSIALHAVEAGLEGNA